MDTASNHTQGLGKATVALIFYMSMSVAMTITNKVLVTKFDFPFHCSLLFLQNLAGTSLMAFANLGALREVLVRDGGRPLLDWIPSGILFVFMLATSFPALKFLSIPMVTTLKNLATV